MRNNTKTENTQNRKQNIQNKKRNIKRIIKNLKRVLCIRKFCMKRATSVSLSSEKSGRAAHLLNEVAYLKLLFEK
jgi:hypothetical protein